MNEDCCQTTSTQSVTVMSNSPSYDTQINDTLLNDTILEIPWDNHSDAVIENSNNSLSRIPYIVRIPLFTFIIILASTYIILVLSRKTLRSAKFTWLTVNVCFTSAFFAIIQLLSMDIDLKNNSDTVILCRLEGFIIDMATCDIMYSHCVASWCRLLAIKYPHKPLLKSSHWLLSNIGASWIAGLLVVLPYIFLDSFACSGSYGKKFLQIYSSLSIILIPIIIVGLCNIAIFRYVRQSSKRIHSFGENTVNHVLFSRRDMHLCKIMLLTFCVFIIGRSPLFIAQVFFNNGKRLPSGVTIFFEIVLPTSLLADVILLIYSDEPVRNVLLKVLKYHGIIPCSIKS